MAITVLAGSERLIVAPPRLHLRAYWALVFPIGMYGAATFRMVDAIRLDRLAWLPQVTPVAALVAWFLTFVSLLHHNARSWLAARP